ncbi:MAG TPA: extracellular solute-binding protein [bacterium]|nr:extracellular solute-binding protein [bacterium]HQP97758.1 extracellular solute-binding protein [bacterium]
MKKQIRNGVTGLAFLIIALALIFPAVGSAPQVHTGLRVACGDWSPSDFFATLVSDFTAETGIPVEVVKIPWSEYQTVIQNAWQQQSDEFDLIIGDSQWLGTGAEHGHYADLSDLVHLVKNQFTSQSIAAYCEYPAGGGRYYALPCESDCAAFAYRRDLFEDPAERSSFQARYGRELTVPQTWREFRDVAEFFTRPPDLYGAAMFYSDEYDFITSGFQQILWSFGGEFLPVPDRGTPSRFVKAGMVGDIKESINSPAGVEALTFFIDLLQFNPPDVLDYTDVSDTEGAFFAGKVAICQQWIALMPQFTGALNPYKEQTGFFVTPGQDYHFISLGGQGISLSAYSKNQEIARQFLSWFAQDAVQLKWAQLGGLSSSVAVIASETFLQAEPYNPVFMQSLPLVRDFYNIPEYAELLQSTQIHLYAAARGIETPQEALDRIAAEHEQILSARSNVEKWTEY